MRILERSVYVGPSLYAHFPVIRLELPARPSVGEPVYVREVDGQR